MLLRNVLLKRLNPRPEMVWPREAVEPTISGTRAHGRQAPPADEPQRHRPRRPVGLLGRDPASTAAAQPGRRRKGNFPPCKSLKTHKTRKESRFCPSRSEVEGTRYTYGGGAARVGHAHDPSVLNLTAKRSRPEMVAWRITQKKIGSAAREMVGSRRASNPQDMVRERAAETAAVWLRLTDEN